MALFDDFLSSLRSDVSQARQSLPSIGRAFASPYQGPPKDAPKIMLNSLTGMAAPVSRFVEELTQTPEETNAKMLEQNPELRNFARAMGKTPDQLAREAVVSRGERRADQILSDLSSRRGSGTSGRNGVGPQGPAVADETTMTPAEAYSEAIRPRDVTYSNIFGTTAFDPETGAISTEAADPFRQFTTGLMGQLSGAMEAYQQFDPAAQAQRYIDAVTARQTEQRDLKDQTNLSRLIASGSLGRSAQARAERDLMESRGIQDVQTQLMAQNFAEQQRQQQLSNIGGLFNLAGGVAQQQFAPYQIALETVPTLQEIYGAPQEPLFQEGMFEKQLEATRQANRAQQSTDLFSVLFGRMFG